MKKNPCLNFKNQMDSADNCISLIINREFLIRKQTKKNANLVFHTE